MSSLSKFPKNHEKRGEEKEDDGFGEKVANGFPGWNRFISDPLPPWNETGRNEKVWKRRVASLPRAHSPVPAKLHGENISGVEARGRARIEKNVAEGRARDDGAGAKIKWNYLNAVI